MSFARYGNTAPSQPFVFSCEHASNAIPLPLTPDAKDKSLLATHWAYDQGAATVAKKLIAATNSCGVLAEFSRLVCDPNRPPGDPTWIVTAAEGQQLSFNQNLDQQEHDRRQKEFCDPYHAAIDDLIGQRLRLHGEFIFVAVHSFVPVLGGEERTMELGVLFDNHEKLAQRVKAELKAQGFITALNQPYSGFDDLIYSVSSHGNRHDIPYFEIEIRQDLIDDEQKISRVCEKLAAALSRLAP